MQNVYIFFTLYCTKIIIFLTHRKQSKLWVKKKVKTFVQYNVLDMYTFCKMFWLVPTILSNLFCIILNVFQLNYFSVFLKLKKKNTAIETAKFRVLFEKYRFFCVMFQHFLIQRLWK